MQLSVPQRGVADAGSFPVEPADVGIWLGGLSTTSESDAREIYRGLKHSNRLRNDPDRRRAVLERFLPVLRELHEQLVELTRAQPLPLVREFARGASLVEALLREEAFAFKILLAEADTPDPEDARRAMQALTRQAELAVHGYRRLPDPLVEDAHALYALAESRGLLAAERDPGTPGAFDHYRYLLLLAAADTHQLRARQLPLALAFLREAVDATALERIAGAASGLGADALCVDIDRGARPERTASLLVSDPEALRLLDTDELIGQIDRRIARTRVNRANTLGVDVLERQTLGRLRTAFAGERARRGARVIAHQPQPALFGHREITTRLLYDPAHTGEGDAAPAAPGRDGWILVNRSSQGACLVNPICLPGTVQVGELIALDGPLADRPAEGGETPAPEARTAESRRPASGAKALSVTPDQSVENARSATLLGTVRWVRSDGGSGITLGLEYLARGVMPVSVMPSDSDANVAEHALIIACKVQQSVVQTILLPPYLYDVGAQLIAAQGKRTRKLRLQTCLQSNGLFGHFLIE